jgi:hypothetical protein
MGWAPRSCIPYDGDPNRAALVRADRLKRCDVVLREGAHVRCVGKGRKERSDVDPIGRTTGTAFLVGKLDPFRSPDITLQVSLSAAVVVGAVGMWATLLRLSIMSIACAEAPLRQTAIGVR